MSDGIGKAKRARVTRILLSELAQSLENDGATPEDIRAMASEAAQRALEAHRTRTGEPEPDLELQRATALQALAPGLEVAAALIEARSITEGLHEVTNAPVTRGAYSADLADEAALLRNRARLAREGIHFRVPNASAAVPAERVAEAYICGVLDPDTLALEDIILFSNWKGYNGSLPMQTQTRDLRKPMVVIHHVRGTDVEDCTEQLRTIWSVTRCAEGAIHARFPWESFAR